MKTIYLAGDMLKKGSILLREQEAQQLRDKGYKIYSPIEDKEINDKANQTKQSNDGLAERIVEKDTSGILTSDIIVIEPHENALGTMVELGQIKGYKDSALFIRELIDSIMEHKHKNDMTDRVTLRAMVRLLTSLANVLDKEVYPHIEDIRRTDIPEQGDRRSYGINQYVYGTCLNITDGKGLYEWDEILEILGGRE